MSKKARLNLKETVEKSTLRVGPSRALEPGGEIQGRKKMVKSCLESTRDFRQQPSLDGCGPAYRGSRMGTLVVSPISLCRCLGRIVLYCIVSAGLSNIVSSCKY